MEFQLTLGQSPGHDSFQPERLSLAIAMHDDVVSITLEGDGRIVPAHPDIEGIMQEEVGQQRADNPTLRGALLPSHQSSIR